MHARVLDKSEGNLYEDSVPIVGQCWSIVQLIHY